jgi:hypothetical protein
VFSPRFLRVVRTVPVLGLTDKMAATRVVTARPVRRATPERKAERSKRRRKVAPRTDRARCAARTDAMTVVRSSFVTKVSDAWNAGTTTIVPQRRRTASRARAWAAVPPRLLRTPECQIVRRRRARAGRRMTNATRRAATRDRARPAPLVTMRQARVSVARPTPTVRRACARPHVARVSIASPMRRVPRRSRDAGSSPAHARLAPRAPTADMRRPSAIRARSRAASVAAVTRSVRANVATT